VHFDPHSQVEVKMNRHWIKASAWSLLISGVLPAQAAIFDQDTRQDLYEVRDPAVLTLARSTIAIFSKDWISDYLKDPKIILDSSTGDYRVGGHLLKDFTGINPTGNKLCSTERFVHQYSDAHCSGALIAEDIILTAGHCIKNQEACKDSRIIFGYDAESPTDAGKARFPARDVYLCKEIIHTATPEWGGPRTTDFSIVRLDRPVVGRPPLAVDLNPDYRVGQDLFTIGHPAGTPTKFSSGKTLYVDQSTDGSIPPMLHTTITAFAGKSGGPVFDQKTLKIVGVIQGGSADFELAPDQSCLVSKVYETKNALLDGEIPWLYNLVTRTSAMDFSGVLTR
jgi:V8-like Glu-specific endopeptidase